MQFNKQTLTAISHTGTTSSTYLAVSGSIDDARIENFSDGAVFKLEGKDSYTYISHASVGTVRISDGGVAEIYVDEDNNFSTSTVALSAFTGGDDGLTSKDFYKAASMTGTTASFKVSDIGEGDNAYAGLAFADSTTSAISKVTAFFKADSDNDGRYSIESGTGYSSSAQDLSGVVISGASETTLNVGIALESLTFTDTAASQTFVVNGAMYVAASNTAQERLRHHRSN